MKITETKIADIKPYERNQKKHPETQIKNIATSIEKYGFVQPLVLSKDNEIIIGHGRYLAAQSIGMENVPCVYAENLTEEKIKELRILDNKLNESDWDFELLKEELDSLDFSDFNIDFDIPMDEDSEEAAEEDEDNIYTTTTNIPQYEIKGEKPQLSELVNNEKANALITEINNSNLSEDIKEFLRAAAYRHNVFDYRKIAEYYAQSDCETQKLMEKSALVIIDIQDAIANGYVEFKKGLEAILDDAE